MSLTNFQANDDLCYYSRQNSKQYHLTMWPSDILYGIYYYNVGQVSPQYILFLVDFSAYFIIILSV